MATDSLDITKIMNSMITSNPDNLFKMMQNTADANNRHMATTSTQSKGTKDDKEDVVDEFANAAKNALKDLWKGKAEDVAANTGATVAEAELGGAEMLKMAMALFGG